MITVLRLGHRPERDKRITTHVCLVARAFGADGVIVTKKDEKLEKTVMDIVKRFGGNFNLTFDENWKNIIKNFKGVKVHLTMYGIPVQNVLDKIPRDRDILIIVGSQKVPGEVYKLSDFNVAITNQPHSEVSSLAIFLDRYLGGRELYLKFNGEYRVVPSERGKNLKIFNENECLKVLRDLKMPEKLIKHSIAVKNLAVKIAELAGADIPLVICGSLLHDIGRLYDSSISHGITGSKIARDLGYPEEVVNIIKRHVGAGIGKEEAEKLGLDETDLEPVTLEEKIVSHADNLIVNEKKVKLQDVIEFHRKKGMYDVARKIERLHRELSEIIGKDIDDIW